MVWGYLAQVVIFGSPLESLTMLGAALMLSGVLVMACARTPAAAAPRAQAAADAAGSEELTDLAAEPSWEEDETESLGSYIATEFSARMPHEPSPSSAPVRQRKASAVDREVTAQRIGAAA
mmetsp:Transcript_119383/g.380718  ORF Transcript_119383/g.380718 Transcript_119383/m.380718 type:complete len:121 (-) Transcript_119383:208-570(-)